MTDFGAQLCRAREARGISLRQVANATRITVRALEAVERNDVARLPGGIFTRAFVRAYAAEVGLDPEVALRAFLAQCPDEGTAVPASASEWIDAEGSGSWSERVPLRPILVAILVLALAGAAAYVFVRWNDARPGPRAEAASPLVPAREQTASGCEAAGSVWLLSPSGLRSRA